MQLQTSPALDVTRIAPKLYMGSAPPHGPLLAQSGFDAVVLCALEYQPRSSDLAEIIVVHAGIDDSLHPTPEDMNTALEAATMAADLIMEGKRVLISCWMGKNRSGLVTALTLMILYGISGKTAVRRVREARPGALINPAFVAFVEHS